ncbi:probable LRR receptor-like serine/threonine-protein kinase At2g16250 [Humulus lupulus]|uniref:probable LRR receptor-like serine/threonine-protein kinase At2g16250 n=1 Tax=Humulus lupulus TaxID=3486 RepID=UPI002B4031FB|nr:probable LRR receptor-like serine/threonine-protein kinase At2g16250 [Humulus lupulus]
MVDPRRTVTFLAFSFFLLLSLIEPTFQQQPSSPRSSTSELSALLQLRSSLGLRSKDWPRKVDPCVFWNGIKCANGRVVEINISGFKRTRLGRQNPQFSVQGLTNLTLLTTFNASNFLLPGSMPNWFGDRLPALQVLDLRSCSVFGSIPYSLGNLTTLTSLFLSRNNLTGIVPASLGQLSRLTALDLSQNLLTGSIPSSFASLKNLSLLDISSNSLLGSIPLGIGTLFELRVLNLSTNNLSSLIPAQLGDLASLVDLDLSFNSLSGSLPLDLRGLRSLRRMILGNNFLGGSLPNNLFPTPIRLEFVVLSRNSFTGSLPNVLWSAPELRFLDVSSNNFSGLLPNSSLNANATAAVLNVSQNLFYGGLTPGLRRFSSVDLSWNYLEGEVLNTPANASIESNCFQNLSNQRTVSDCESFYAEKGLRYEPPSSAQPPAIPETRKKSNNRMKVIILAAVLGGVGLILLLAIFSVLVLFCVRKRGNTTQRGVGVGPVPTSSTPPTGASVNYSSVGDAFTYQQLLQATGDFSDSNLIKNGHSGDVFRGVLESGIPVVIKKIDLPTVKKETHMVELDFFSKVSHARFVPFLGHCLENENENEKFLVYKYLPNGDLSSSLFKKTNTEDGLQSLDWITRLKIALGAAEGLSYLHHECNPPLVHRDVQASSILLDDKFEVRLGSLSEVCTQEGDTHHSKITRLLRLPQSSEQGASGTATAMCAYDVYCFGKVLLELVTGKLGISASGDGQVKEWLDQTLPCISIYDKELVTKIVDPSLIVDDDLLEEVWAMAVVARSCLNPKPSRRPLMRYILKALENPLKVVREENSGSARLRTTSSRGSWNAALFGSWRSMSDVTVIPAASSTKVEVGSGLKHSGTTGSQGSGQNGGGDHSSSYRRHSREIFPEPSSVQDVERADRD